MNPKMGAIHDIRLRSQRDIWTLHPLKGNFVLKDEVLPGSIISSRIMGWMGAPSMGDRLQTLNLILLQLNAENRRPVDRAADSRQVLSAAIQGSGIICSS